MTYDEFVYQHDLDMIYDLLERHAKFNHYVQSDSQEKTEKVEKVSGKEFFI